MPINPKDCPYQTVDIPSYYPSGIYWAKVKMGEKKFISKVLIIE
jgi:hypothetical protein